MRRNGMTRHNDQHFLWWNRNIPVASFTKEVNPRLAKRPLKTTGRLANLELTFLVKEATVRGTIVEYHYITRMFISNGIDFAG